MAISIIILLPDVLWVLQMTGVPHSDIYFFFVAVVHSPKSRLIQLKKEKLEYTPGEHEHGLFPAPIHVGGYFVCVSVGGKQVSDLGDIEVLWTSQSLCLSPFFYIIALPGYSCLSAYELCQRSYSSLCVLQCRSLTRERLFGFSFLAT